jgi:hypothetical protein
MALTLTTADAALKEDYQPTMREQLNNAHMLLNQVERNTEDVEGRRAVLSLHTNRNAGVGARGEGGTLPTAGNQGYSEERISLRYNYGRIQINGPVIKAMKSDKGSFTRAVKSETQGVTNDLKQDVERQLFGTSDGVIATCTTTTASTTLNLATTTTAVQMRQFRIGMRIDVGTLAEIAAGSGGAGHNLTISAISTTNKTLTVSSAVTTDSSDYVARQGSGGSGANQKELTGLQTIVAASGTLFNVDPTAVPEWASYVDSNSGTNRAPVETLFVKAIQQGEIAGGATIDLFITSDGVHRGLAAQMQSQKRFVNTNDLKGGYKGLAIDAAGTSATLTYAKDAPLSQAFGLSTSHLVQFESSDWEWMDEDGAVLSRVSGVDAYEATLYKYHELATDKRNAHVLVKDLTES